MGKSLVACVEDLFFRSKIDATARHLSVDVRFVGLKELEAACGQKATAAVLLELSSNGPLEAVRRIRDGDDTKGLPVIGFLSHVDRDLASQAEAAGVTRVLPRSQFTETLPELMMDLVAPGARRDLQEEPELPDE